MYNTRIKNAGFYLGQLMRDAENLFDEEVFIVIYFINLINLFN